MAVIHQHLPLEQVRPGMVLSDVLLDAHGQVLLPQGAVLTENMLSLMPRHGIAMLPIQAPKSSPFRPANGPPNRKASVPPMVTPIE